MDFLFSDMGKVTHFLEQNLKSNEIVVLGPLNYFSTLYYHREDPHWYVYAEKTKIEYYQGGSLITDKDPIMSATALKEEKRYVWLVENTTEQVGAPSDWKKLQQIKVDFVTLTEYQPNEANFLEGRHGR